MTPAQSETADSSRVTVHREFGQFTGNDMRRVGKLLDQCSGPRRLLVQWVPHGYGRRSMNLQFCLWIRRRAAKHHDVVELMVHEPYLAFGEGSWKQNGAAVVHRLMTTVLLNAARRVWISIPAWERRLRPYALGRALSFRWVPVPSNIPVVDDPAAVASIRTRLAPEGGQLVGHFGTYDRSRAELLSQAVPSLLQRNAKCRVLLLGRGSEEMSAELTVRHPELAGRIHAAGQLPASELSLHISACDLLIQPYIDGVSSRRTSVMVGLSHGVPIVTTIGASTEALWNENEAVALAPVTDISALVRVTEQLLVNPTSRQRLGIGGHALYTERFDVRLCLSALRGPIEV